MQLPYGPQPAPVDVVTSTIVALAGFALLARRTPDGLKAAILDIAISLLSPRRPWVVVRDEYGDQFEVGRYRTLKAAQDAVERDHFTIDVPEPMHIVVPPATGYEWEWDGDWETLENGRLRRHLMDGQFYEIRERT